MRSRAVVVRGPAALSSNHSVRTLSPGRTVVYSIRDGGSYLVVTHVSPRSRVKTQPSSAAPLSLCTMVHDQSGIQSYSRTGQSSANTSCGVPVKVSGMSTTRRAGAATGCGVVGCGVVGMDPRSGVHP